MALQHCSAHGYATLWLKNMPFLHFYLKKFAQILDWNHVLYMLLQHFFGSILSDIAHLLDMKAYLSSHAFLIFLIL